MISTLAKSVVLLAASTYIPSVTAHATIWTDAMWGFNVSAQSPTPMGSDDRPVVPLMYRTFEQWWFHGHLAYPPHPDSILMLPAGGTKTVEIACDKAATTFWPSSAGSLPSQGNDGNDVCPGQPSSEYHTNGPNDLGGCALAIAYKSDVNDVQPEDFTVFSVQTQCVWTRYTDFAIPAAMPACPNGKCTCAWFWIHKADSGSEQMYMTGFQCGISGATSTTPVAKGKVPRRCGADPDNNIAADPSNCTVGAKTPMYWYQNERNNMFEGQYSPPLYQELYGFHNGAQNDIFEGSASPVTTTTASVSRTTTTSSSSSAATSSSSSAVGSSSSVAGSSSSTAGPVTTSVSTSVVGGEAGGSSSSVVNGSGGTPPPTTTSVSGGATTNVVGGGAPPATSTQAAGSSVINNPGPSSSVVVVNPPTSTALNTGVAAPVVTASTQGGVATSSVDSVSIATSSATFIAPPPATTNVAVSSSAHYSHHHHTGSWTASAPFTTATNSHGQVCKKRKAVKKAVTLGDLSKAQVARAQAHNPKRRQHKGRRAF